MDERRAAVRKRVLYGAVTATLADDRRYDCVVKNWSDLGARVEFAFPAQLTEEVALTLTQTGTSYRARVVWTRDNAVGLAFTSAPANAYIPKDALDNEIRDTKEAARLLNKLVDDVLAES
jgi:hypothetical protein